MKTPKILPWIAKRAGISEMLATQLWRRASGESRALHGNSDSSDYYRYAVERFLALVETEAISAPQHSSLTSAPRLTWMWRHQSRIALLSLLATQNTYQLWQNNLSNIYSPRKAA